MDANDQFHIRRPVRIRLSAKTADNLWRLLFTLMASMDADQEDLIKTCAEVCRRLEFASGEEQLAAGWEGLEHLLPPKLRATE